MNHALQKPALAQAEALDWRGRLYRITNSQAFVAFLFLLIPVLLLAALKIWPVFYNLYLSFTRYELFEPPRFVGMKNYNYVFSNSVTRQSIFNTLLFHHRSGAHRHGAGADHRQAAGSIHPRPRLLRTLYYLPVVSSVVVSAMIWRWIYSPQHGLLNYFLGLVGIPPQNWLNDPNLALISLVIVTIWGSIGSNMIIFLAGLQDIPSDIIEAARVDGANPLQNFLFITVPLMRPVILFVVVTFTISIFRNFGLIFMLTQGGPFNRTNTMVWEVYQNVFGYLAPGAGGGHLCRDARHRAHPDVDQLPRLAREAGGLIMAAKTLGQSRHPGSFSLWEARLPLILTYVFLVIGAIVMMMPFVWMVSTSIKPDREIFGDTIRWIPTELDLQNYTDAFEQTNMPRLFLNTVVVTAVAVASQVLLGSMAGYAFARLHFRGKMLIFFALLTTMMVPFEVLIIPVFLLIKFFPLAGGNDILGQGGTGLINTLGRRHVPQLRLGLRRLPLPPILSRLPQGDRRSGNRRRLLAHWRLLAHPRAQLQTGHGHDGALRLLVVLE